jgi:hypothetical protein
MSSTAVWTFDELAVGASTGGLGNWLPTCCPLVGAWSGGWLDEAIGEIVHWCGGVRQTSQNF